MQLGHHCNQLRHIEELVLANGLQRAELFNYAVEDLPALRELVRHHDLRVGVHAPLLRKPWYPFFPTWTFLHDVDDELRNLSLRLAEESIAESAALGAEYVVIHFPAPPSPATALLTLDEQRSIAWESCRKLDEWARRAGIGVYLESFGPSPFFTADFLAEVFTAFPDLAYCWDTGHMHYASQRDDFDYYEMAEALHPFVRSIQMWGNRTFDDYRTFHHIPVHPSQDPAAGWVDIECTLRYLVARRPDMPVIFESAPRYPAELGGHDYREGIRWVKTILANTSS